jgi:hypothetical protein
MKGLKYLFFLLLIVSSTFQVLGQDAEVDCAQILLEYQALIQDGASSLNDLIQLQSWRRALESADPLPCVEDGYKALVAAINLTGDAIAMDLDDRPDEAEPLFAQASEQEQIAFNEIEPTSSGVDSAVITSPTDGQTGVDFTVIVEGTYPADQYDFTTPDQLWLFVVPASNQRRYPQIVEGCDAAARSPIAYNNGNLNMAVLLGDGAQGGGEPFTIILMSADSAATEALYAIFDEWCATGDFSGLSAREVAGIAGLEQLDSVTVTRAP